MSAIVPAPTSQPALVGQAVPVIELQARAKKIRQAMKSVMKPKVHYGVIPGTGKPTLYKPGSETLLAMFNIAAEPVIEDLSTSDEVRYRVVVKGVHTPTGAVVGYGVGECSTNEEKYKWRNAVCDEEYQEADEDRRRIKWQRSRNQQSGEWETWSRKMVRTEPADLANTVLKMAKKRAQIDLTLTALGASDVFNQDIEDLTVELRETIVEEGTEPPANHDNRSKPQTRSPQSRGGSGGNGRRNSDSRCTEKQLRLIRLRLDQAGIPENEFLHKFEIDRVEDLPFARVNDALQWIARPSSDEEGDDRELDPGDGHQENGYPD